MGFVSDFFDAFGAQRLRLRSFAQEPRASLIEFVLFAAFVLAALGPLIAGRGYQAAPWGPLLPVAFVGACVFFYSRYRPFQNEEGEAEIAARRRYDRGVLLAAGLIALLSVLTFWWAMEKGQAAPSFLPNEYDVPQGYEVELIP